jgi:GNAT superfamily N-acetyltransferase
LTRELANRHWAAAFEDLVEDLGGDFRRFGTVVAFLGNLPLPFANGCLVLESTSSRDLEEAINWVLTGKVPFQVRVDTNVLDSVADVIAARGFERDPEDMPAMVLNPIPEIPAVAPGLSAVTVTSATYRVFLDLLVASGIPSEFAAQIFPKRLIGSPNAEYFVASLDGRPVGISVAVRTGDSGGIYSVATLEDARRRGVGTSVTWAAVGAIRDWGCQAAVLQSSTMGYPVYRSMGFEEVVRYARFIPHAQALGASIHASQ